MNAPGVLSNDVVTYWFTLPVIYSAEKSWHIIQCGPKK